MRRAFRAAALVVGVFTVFGTLAPTALGTHDFGDTPLNFVQSEANDSAGCAGSNNNATSDKLKARALSIGWNEVTDQDNQVPSPMAVSRWEDDDDQYWNHSRPGLNSDFRRLYWHSGVGIWQLDDAGLGTNLADAKFSSHIGAREAIDYMKPRLCDGLNPYASPGDWTWYGCQYGDCLTDYQQIFNAGGPLQDFNGSANVSEFGGSPNKNCYIQTPHPPAPFECRYFKPSAAEGFSGNSTTGWVADVDGSGDRDPLAKNYYVFNTQNSNGDPVEVRWFMPWDTAFNHALMIQRKMGTNSHLDGVLSFIEHPSDKLCDENANCATG